ncbi:MAG: hypothetical protein ACP5IO_03480 [Elusimicrobiales bacterium]
MKGDNLIVRCINSNRNDDKIYIEPEIVSGYRYQKTQNRFFFRVYKKGNRFIAFIFLIFVLISFLFVTIGLILSTTFIGALIGIPLVFIGIIGIYLSVRILRFFKDIVM